MSGEARTLARTVVLHHYLAEFLHASTEISIDVIVLKGAALAETAYPRLGLRPFADLDILVRLDDATRARALLERLGYGVKELHWAELVSGRDCQADFVKQTTSGPVILELHTNLINNDLFWGCVSVDLAGCWERRQPATLAGTQGVYALGPEDQILHLCLHLAGHYLIAPRSVQDTAQVCAVCDVDWELFTQIARQAHAATIAYAGLFLAQRLCAANIPSAVLEGLAPAASKRARLESLALARAADPKEAATYSLRLPLLLLLLDSPQARARAVIRLLFPSRRWLRDHYPEATPGVLPAAHLRALARAALAFARR